MPRKVFGRSADHNQFNNHLPNETNTEFNRIDTEFEVKQGAAYIIPFSNVQRLFFSTVITKLPGSHWFTLCASVFCSLLPVVCSL